MATIAKFIAFNPNLELPGSVLNRSLLQFNHWKVTLEWILLLIQKQRCQSFLISSSLSGATNLILVQLEIFSHSAEGRNQITT